MDHQSLSGPSSGPTSANSATGSASPLPPGGAGPRGTVASLACDVCRRKKIKCSEGRPKCTHCAERDLECQYREAPPVKKDQTSLKILDIVTRMEQDLHEQKEVQLEQGKVQSEQGRILTSLIDGLRSGGMDMELTPSTSQNSPFTLPQSRNTPGSQQTSATRRTSASTMRRETRSLHPLNPSEGGFSQPYRHATAAHKMLTWPAIQSLLKNTGASNSADIYTLSVEGSAFIVRMCKNMPRLPLDEIPFDEQKPFSGMQTMENRYFGGPRMVFQYLTYDKMVQLATVYFNTFNILYPFMDREGFLTKTLQAVKDQGFDSDAPSVTALLIFALGEVAEDTLSRRSSDRYPGIKLYNEARKRMGFVQTSCDVDNVQICSLAALYLQCCFHHVDFWRMASSGAAALHILVTCNSINWDSPHGELVKRAYWHCAILETGLHLELDLPLTGILDIADPPSSVMNWEHEEMNISEEDNCADAISQYRAHYASQLTLRRLCSQLHDEINESMGTARKHGTTSEGFGGPTAETLTRLEESLENWRNLLAGNLYLQWPEDDPTAYPFRVDPQLMNIYHNVDPTLGGTAKMFYTHSQPSQLRFPYVYEIQVALLRTRYYYAKYMIYRPYIYKVLHFPEELDSSDMEAAATCLKSCLKWPLMMPPLSANKRLIPYLFCWSQNFLGIILILTLSRTNRTLAHVVEKYCGGKGSQFEIDANETVGLMVEWIRDLAPLCPIASWCLDILTPLLEPGI